MNLLAARPWLAATALLCLGGSRAWAAEPAAFSMQTVRPSAGASDTVLQRGAEIPAAADWLALTSLHYARAPLQFSAAGYKQTVIGDLAMAELAVLCGLPNDFAIGAAIPAAVVLRGGGPNLVQLASQPQAPALGDIRLEGRRQLWNGPLGGGHAALTAAAVWELPTADRSTFLGGQHAVDASLLFGGRFGGWRSGGSAGARLTGTSQLQIHPLAADGTLDTSRQITALKLGSAAHLAGYVGREVIADTLTVAGELQAWLPLGSTVPASQVVADLALTGQWSFAPWLSAVVAVGGSPSGGAGSAAWRAFAALRWQPGALPRDQDGDGIADGKDKCPKIAEDKDGFQDEDGCPDLDDDNDGIEDSKDKCRLLAEDRDGFEDADGCPDLDDDGDGIADSKDLCPRKAEDKDGRDDDDGCPDLDDDGDGIEDKDDLCPLQPERVNGFEDGDGCPDFAPGEAPKDLDLSEPATPAAAPAAPPKAPEKPDAAPPPTKPAPAPPAVKPAPAPPKAKAAPGAAAKPAPAAEPDAENGKPKVKVKPIDP